MDVFMKKEKNGVRSVKTGLEKIIACIVHNIDG